MLVVGLFSHPYFLQHASVILSNSYFSDLVVFLLKRVEEDDVFQDDAGKLCTNIEIAVGFFHVQTYFCLCSLNPRRHYIPHLSLHYSHGQT